MKKILIVQSRFYEEISDQLLKGAINEINKAGFEYEMIEVPGSFEIPAAISMASKSNKYAGFIALGCVIRGETSHYDYVCLESARGLNELAIKDNLALGYGILTTETYDQALIRSDPENYNRGGAAAIAAIRMVEIKEHFCSL